MTLNRVALPLAAFLLAHIPAWACRIGPPTLDELEAAADIVFVARVEHRVPNIAADEAKSRPQLHSTGHFEFTLLETFKGIVPAGALLRSEEYSCMSLTTDSEYLVFAIAPLESGVIVAMKGSFKVKSTIAIDSNPPRTLHTFLQSQVAPKL